MGQQQVALYLRLHWPGVRDVQRQQVFLPEKCPRRCHRSCERQRHPGGCPTPMTPRVRPVHRRHHGLHPSALQIPCAIVGMSMTPKRACTTSAAGTITRSGGRFINADTADVLGASPDKANWDKNLFAYCDNNPVSRKMMAGTCGKKSPLWEILFFVAHSFLAVLQSVLQCYQLL